VRKASIEDLHSALPHLPDPRGTAMTVLANGESGNHSRHAEGETDRSRQS
jgi:hypothetical protein